MIMTDRDIFIAAHVTQETKDRFKIEADRRKKSMSLIISELIEKFLETAEHEHLEPIRSNKRTPLEEALAREEDVPLPLEGQ